jgi:hypothetical protein
MAAFLGGFAGGLLSQWVASNGTAVAQKPNGVHAEEFLLLDQVGKARAGLGLDSNGEVGLVLTSKDGSRTLSLSPDERMVIKLAERGGKVLWAAP